MCTSQLTCLRGSRFHGAIPVLNFADNFKAAITTAAWKSKPSWALVAAADRTINPDLERWYATRANSHKVEVAEPVTPSTFPDRKRLQL